MSEIISIKQLNTPIGIMTTGATDRGICMLAFGEKTEFKTTLNYVSEIGDHKFTQETAQQLDEYF